MQMSLIYLLADNQALNSEDLLGSSDDNNEEDDLEIPAFLRRQKN